MVKTRGIRGNVVNMQADAKMNKEIQAKKVRAAGQLYIYIILLWGLLGALVFEIFSCTEGHYTRLLCALEWAIPCDQADSELQHPPHLPS